MDKTTKIVGSAAILTVSAVLFAKAMFTEQEKANKIKDYIFGSLALAFGIFLIKQAPK